MIRRLLVANRGEIACRIMRTAQAQGIVCIAVYSDADRHAKHVRMADIAVGIGPAAASESYLCGDKIIAAAKAHNADGIHPGYGFLSENPEFVETVEKAGIVFVGPSADAIRAMGLKDRAKAVFEQAGVPVVPGYHGDNQDGAHLRAQADKIGYPVMIKAVAGGGGKGMRRVDGAQDFDAHLASARSEAKRSFGNDAVLVEKFISAPRHIEVQVFGDGADAVHLFERDCSLQRRHQKVIEEAPAPDMSDAVRAAMTSAAVRAVKSIGYKGAGTVEFIVDGSGPLREDGFWFLEMNTRLQVEHPVTEAICGVDLVDWQLRVANGEPLPLAQGDIRMTGHAVEARIYAEDAPAGFLPATGRLDLVAFDGTLRVDSGVETGDDITPHYDPMIAKAICHAPTRALAFDGLSRGLAGCSIGGVTTNSGFLSRLLDHGDVRSGRVDTGLIDRDLDDLVIDAKPSVQDLAQAAIALSGVLDMADPLAGFSTHSPLTRTIDLGVPVQISVLSPDRVLCDVDGANVVARRAGRAWFFDDCAARPCHVSGRSVTLFGAVPIRFDAPDPLDRAATALADDVVRAPMPGLLSQLSVNVGDVVHQDDPLAVLEAMKMEHILRAPRDGVIAAILAPKGAQVSAQSVLITLEVDDDQTD